MTGNRIVDPEAHGAMPRRIRLFAEVARRLANVDLSRPVAAGTPIGDGAGMQHLAEMAPLS